MSIKDAGLMISCLLLVGVMLIGIVIYVMKPNGNISALDKQRMRQKKLVKNFAWYRRFESNFLTRGEFNRLAVRIGSLSIYDPQELKVQTVKVYMEALTWYLGINVMGLVVFHDAFICVLVFTFATVAKEVRMAKNIDKNHYKVLLGLAYTLSRLRDLYAKYGNIPDALNECKPPAIVAKAIDSISHIITDKDGEKNLEKFYQATPFRILQTLASVCYILSDDGDTKDSITGVSNFTQAMGMLSNEVNIEIRRIRLQSNLFKNLEYLPLATIPMIPGVEIFFKSVIPGTSVIYGGSLGYLSKVIIILCSLVGFKIISGMNRAVVINIDDRVPFIVKLLENKKFFKFITNIEPKKSETLYKRDKKLKKCLSSRTLEHIYAEKVIYSVIAFLMCICITYLSTSLGKTFIYSNIKELGLTATEELTKEDALLRQKVDAKYLQYPELPTKTETKRIIQAEMRIKDEFDIDNQVTRLMKKYTSYHNAYYHWYYIVIAYICAIIAWFIPEVLLMSREKLIVSEEEEDVLQLQTNICILMNTNLDTMDVIYWLQRQSRVYRYVLLECYHNYAGNAEEALARAKIKSGSSTGFVRMVDKLELTVEQITLKEAFSDLIPERDHILRLRESQQEIMIKKRRSKASKLSLLSLKVLIFLYVVMPIGIVGGTEFVKAMTSMG